jgi:hypothetical protein
MQQQLKKLILYRLALTTITLLMGISFQLGGVSVFWGPYALFYFFIVLIYDISPVVASVLSLHFTY